MIKSFIAAVAVATCCIGNIPSAEAVTRQQFIERLQRIGVTLVSDNCDGAYGYYQADANVMCINQELFTEEKLSLFDNTLVHEGFHTVQDCLNGFEEPTLISMLDWAISQGSDTTKLRKFMQDNMDVSYVEFINNMERGHRRNAEVEAYAMENESELVYELLGSVCLAQ